MYKTTLVSRAGGIAGAIGNGESREPSISASGRYIAFTSQATNLVAGASRPNGSIYVRYLATEATRRVSIGTASRGPIAVTAPARLFRRTAISSPSFSTELGSRRSLSFATSATAQRFKAFRQKLRSSWVPAPWRFQATAASSPSARAIPTRTISSASTSSICASAKRGSSIRSAPNSAPRSSSHRRPLPAL